MLRHSSDSTPGCRRILIEYAITLRDGVLFHGEPMPFTSYKNTNLQKDREKKLEQNDGL